MDSDRTLPARAYLLAYDLATEKLTDKAWLDYVVQGAALAQLLAGGQLQDTGTKVLVAAGFERLIGQMRRTRPRLLGRRAGALRGGRR